MSGYYGTMPDGPRKWLTVKEPDAYLDWTENLRDVLTNPHTGEVDPLVSLSLASKPFGAGELVVSRLSVDPTGFLMTWWEDCGVPGRRYTLNFKGVTAAGRKPQWVFGQECDPVFATWPLPAEPNPGFCTPITWAATDGVLSRAGGYVTLSSLGAWPTSSEGLSPGALYAASPAAPSFIFAVQGFGYVEGPPLMFGDITAGALLTSGAVHLPQSDPHVRDQIWISGEIVCASLG